MKINKLNTGDAILFVGCGNCAGKQTCFFCKKGVKPQGTVVSCYFDFSIPTVDIKVEGSSRILELTQDDLDDPELVSEVVSENR